MRVLPAYQDARTEGRVPKSCDDCKRTAPVTTRQAMGCPYEPRHPHATPWAPRHLIMADARPEVCPGYTTALPEVQEVVVATPHWEHGTLRDLLGGAPSPAMLAGLAALRAGIKERDAAALEERTKGGA